MNKWVTPHMQLSSYREKIPLKAYIELTKPRVVVLMLITAFVGMCLAKGGQLSLMILIAGLTGIGLIAAAAACINHLADRRIDTLMHRTQRRPVAKGQISPMRAMIFSITLMVTGIVILVLFVNTLTALLSILTLVGYAGIYTYYLKRATPQNIVIGGLAGAFPPCLGWAAVSNELHPYALLLALIIFIWTPPHFWALAIYRYDDYVKAQIPMLPVTHGIAFTKLCIVLYTLLLCVVSLLPFLAKMCGWLYLIIALVLGARFMHWSIRLYRSNNSQLALQTFHYSIHYLFLLYVAMLADHYAIVL